MSVGISSDRVRIDNLDANEVAVRCSCIARGTLTIFPLATFMRMGRERALRVADAACHICISQKALPVEQFDQQKSQV